MTIDYILTDQIHRGTELLKSRGTDFVLVWVPDRVGIPGNETADQQAKLGRSFPITETNNKQETIKHCYKKAHEWLLKTWQKHYDNQTKALHYKQIEP